MHPQANSSGTLFGLRAALGLCGSPLATETGTLWQGKARHDQVLGMTWIAPDSETPDFGEVHIPQAEPQHPDARHLYEFWRICEAKGGFRMRRDVPSRTLAPLLSHLTIYEPVDGGSDFRTRLAGTSVRRRFGFEATGRLLSEIFTDGGFMRRRANLRALLTTGDPYVIDVKSMAHGTERLHFEILTLPAIAPDGVSRWILSGLFYFDWDAKTGRSPEMSPSFCAMAASGNA